MLFVNQTNLAMTYAGMNRLEDAAVLAERTVFSAQRHDIPVVIIYAELILAWCAAEEGNFHQFRSSISSGLAGLQNTKLLDADIIMVLERIKEAADANGWPDARVAVALDQQLQRLNSH
jgi:hypothetical protein